MKSSIMRSSRLAVALVAGSLALAACGSSGGGANAASGNTGSANAAATFTTGFVGSTAAGTPKYGGTLTIADFSEPRSLDPTVTYPSGPTGGSAMAAIYDELVRYDYTTNSFVPELAQSLTGSKNNTVWTLKLRPGVTFTNGQPLDSAAVLGSLKYYESRYGYQTGLMLTNVASTTAPDAQTVVFTLRAPWSQFPDMLAQGPGMIMAPAAYANPKAFKPIGAGPFTYGTYAPGEDLILNANPKYFGGKPYLDSLKFVWLGGVDDNPKLQAVTSGTADTAYLRDPQVITKAKKSGLSGMMVSTGMADNLWINTRAGHPGSNLLVRQAISAAFDGTLYGQRTVNSAGVVTRSLFSPSSPWYAQSSQTYNIAQAKKYLAEAKAQGYNGKISYAYSATPTAQTGAVLIQAMLQAAGFQVTLVPITSVADQVQTLYVQHNFDLAIAASSLADLDPYASIDTLLSGTSPTNLSGWSSPQMDSLLAQLRASSDASSGARIMAQIQKVWDANVPGISVDAGGVFQVWASNVHGIEPTTQTLMLYTKAWKG